MVAGPPRALFPAGAGMNRSISLILTERNENEAVPRRRGDEPAPQIRLAPLQADSVPRRRGDEPLDFADALPLLWALFPAGAGMNRRSTASSLLSTLTLFPAGAGMNRLRMRFRTLLRPVPRRRGDEPLGAMSAESLVNCSPQPRG